MHQMRAATNERRRAEPQRSYFHVAGAVDAAAVHLRLPPRGRPENIAVHSLSPVRAAVEVLCNRLYSDLDGNLFYPKGNAKIFFAAVARPEHHLEEAEAARVSVRDGPGQPDGNRDYHRKYDGRAVQHQHPVANRASPGARKIVVFQLRQNSPVDAKLVPEKRDQQRQHKQE